MVDGDRANQTSSWLIYQGIVRLSSGCHVTDCGFQNIKATAILGTGAAQLRIPYLRTCTTSTSGGSLSNSTAYWYRITAIDADGQTQPSNERTVTTGGPVGRTRTRSPGTR